MSKYQLLPPLAHDDMERLKASIKERGVKMPVVVDEHGEILDGHNRVMIADSLGIEYPTIVERGLDDHEKRIFVAELNAARRQLTMAQKVMLGRQIEPDIEAVARKKQQEAGKVYGRGSDSSGTDVPKLSEPVRTRDEVARAVQIGSGRTYERGKQVLAQLEAEPDGPQLLRHVESGDWDLDDVRQELKTRRTEQAKKQAREEQATSDRYMQILGDPEGRIAEQRLRTQFSSIRAAIYDRLLPLKPDAVATVLDEQGSDVTRMFIRDTRAWLDALEREMSAGIRVIHRKDAV